MTAFPDATRTAAALASLDVLAIADILDTPTTRLATHVLPCAGPLERSDVPWFTDTQLPAVYTQYAPPVVPRHASRRPLWWQFARLAELLGLDVLGGRRADDCCDDDVLELFADRGRVPFAELKEACGPVVAEPSATRWVEARLPDGRWNLAPVELVAQLAATEDPDPGRLVLIPRRERKSVNSLRARVVDASSESRVWMNPTDAEARGIRTGHDVIVASATGEVTGTAVVTTSVVPGAVSIVHGNDPNVSCLTSARCCDPLTGMVQQSGLPITVRRAGARD
jgi:anaerobic selenocysteine-containing dehydrogenase